MVGFGGLERGDSTSVEYRSSWNDMDMDMDRTIEAVNRSKRIAMQRTSILIVLVDVIE